MDKEDIEKWWSLVKAGDPNIGIAQQLYKAQKDDTKLKLRTKFYYECLLAVYDYAVNDKALCSKNHYIMTKKINKDLKVTIELKARNPSTIGRKLNFGFQNTEWYVKHVSIFLGMLNKASIRTCLPSVVTNKALPREELKDVAKNRVFTIERWAEPFMNIDDNFETFLSKNFPS